MVKHLAKVFVITFIWIGIYSQAFSQVRTVGTLSIDPASASNGFNLLYPHFQPNVYLLDQCGRVVHQWDDTSSTPGNIAYLDTSGNLFKGKKPLTLPNPTYGAGGAGGIVEVRDWDNNLLWTRSWMDSVYRQHHDLAVMPNGNFLVIVWERFRGQDVIDKGAAIPERWTGEEIWSDAIYEIDFVNDSIVWEWHAWDHTIQDEDNTKSNFGVVSEHPEKIDINYAANTVGRPDWLHINSIDYNPKLDQILMSVPHLDEIWIIDHSTTTAEAATESGGNSGKGGGIIYRWGNPESHDSGTDEDRQLFFQHDANWIDDVPDDHPYKDKISIFNNRVEDSLSVAIIIDPKFDASAQVYPTNAQGHYEPTSPEFSLVHPDSVRMFSSGLSSFQVLEDDRFLICSGRNGYSFELDSDQEIYWEYKTPFNAGSPAAQGDILEVNDNITFKIQRYPVDYAGFSALQLADDPMTIETNNPSDFCAVLTPTNDLSVDTEFKIYPNPSAGDLYIDLEEDGRDVVILDGLGREIIRHSNYKNGELISLFHMKRGIYFIKIEGINVVSKLILLGN